MLLNQITNIVDSLMHYTHSLKRLSKNFANLDLEVQEVMMFKHWYVSLADSWYKIRSNDWGCVVYLAHADELPGMCDDSNEQQPPDTNINSFHRPNR